ADHTDVVGGVGAERRRPGEGSAATGRGDGDGRRRVVHGHGDGGARGRVAGGVTRHRGQGVGARAGRTGVARQADGDGGVLRPEVGSIQLELHADHTDVVGGGGAERRRPAEGSAVAGRGDGDGRRRVVHGYGDGRARGGVAGGVPRHRGQGMGAVTGRAG